MFDWRVLIGTLAMPGTIAFVVWLAALVILPSADVVRNGGTGALLLLMLQCAYALSGIRLAIEGVAHTVESYRRNLRSEWSLFPNRYDRSAVAIAVALAIGL